MPVYSTMIPDERLITAVEGFKRITIVGCGGCANDSLAYTNNTPLRMRFDNHMGHNMPEPHAMEREVERLKKVLTSCGKEIGSAVGMGMCAISDDEKPGEFKWVEACRNADAVIVLACVAGIAGVKTILGKTVKVIPGMKTAGVLFSYFKKSDNNKELVYIDKDKSSCILIFK